MSHPRISGALPPVIREPRYIATGSDTIAAFASRGKTPCRICRKEKAESGKRTAGSVGPRGKNGQEGTARAALFRGAARAKRGAGGKGAGEDGREKRGADLSAQLLAGLLYGAVEVRTVFPNGAYLEKIAADHALNVPGDEARVFRKGEIGNAYARRVFAAACRSRSKGAEQRRTGRSSFFMKSSFAERFFRGGLPRGGKGVRSMPACPFRPAGMLSRSIVMSYITGGSRRRPAVIPAFFARYLQRGLDRLRRKSVRE